MKKLKRRQQLKTGIQQAKLQCYYCDQEDAEIIDCLGRFICKECHDEHMAMEKEYNQNLKYKRWW